MCWDDMSLGIFSHDGAQVEKPIVVSIYTLPSSSSLVPKVKYTECSAIVNPPADLLVASAHLDCV